MYELHFVSSLSFTLPDHKPRYQVARIKFSSMKSTIQWSSQLYKFLIACDKNKDENSENSESGKGNFDANVVQVLISQKPERGKAKFKENLTIERSNFRGRFKTNQISMKCRNKNMKQNGHFSQIFFPELDSSPRISDTCKTTIYEHSRKRTNANLVEKILMCKHDSFWVTSGSTSIHECSHVIRADSFICILLPWGSINEDIIPLAFCSSIFKQKHDTNVIPYQISILW